MALSLMNYLFAAPTIAFTAGDRVVMDQVQDRSIIPIRLLFAAEYAEKLSHCCNFTLEITQLNLLASHDTARLISMRGDRASVELATLLLLTFPGAPVFIMVMKLAYLVV